MRDRIVAAAKQALMDGKKRTLCPVCKGGSSGEESLSIWSIDNMVFATCHRANCSVGTICVEAKAGRGFAKDPAQPRKSPQYRWNGAWIQEQDVQKLQEKYAFNFSREVLHRCVRASNTAFYFPMWDCDGRDRGMVVRPFKPTGPKALTYADEDYHSGINWYVRCCGTESPDIYAVEDVVSAIALYDMGVDALSLNGTSMSRERLETILERKYRIILMLDADATHVATSMCLRYGPDAVRVVRLTKDIKNMSREEVQALLDSVN